MKIKIGDLVHVKVRVHEFTLLEGVGVIMEEADPDCPEESSSNWLVFCENDHWVVNEKYITRIEKGRPDKNIPCGPTESFAKKIRHLAEQCRKST